MVGSYGRPATVERYALGVEPQELADPGNGGRIAPIAAATVMKLVSGGSETRLLSDPIFEGQEVDLIFETDGGDLVITAGSAINQAGNTALTFADGGDHLRLVGGRNGAGGREWRVLSNDGIALA